MKLNDVTFNVRRGYGANPILGKYWPSDFWKERPIILSTSRSQLTILYIQSTAETPHVLAVCLGRRDSCSFGLLLDVAIT